MSALESIAWLLMASYTLWLTLCLSAMAAGKQAEFYLFSSDMCGPCKKFKIDYTNNKQKLRSYVDRYFAEDVATRNSEKNTKGKHYFEVTWNEETSEWSNPTIVKEFEKATGRQIKGVPVFWVRGRGWSAAGYTEPSGVLEYLSMKRRKKK